MLPALSRITPTCVGNTIILEPGGADPQDHPHVCGEYSMPGDVFCCLSGSPPRVWGILPHVVSQHVAHGITPTCVGNTSRSCCVSRRRWDHPHVCGEYGNLLARLYSTRGSPPRVWGIPRLQSEGLGSGGITPTCVGNTRQPATAAVKAWGSPPRVWGIPQPPPGAWPPTRITPTCVGNTL